MNLGEIEQLIHLLKVNGVSRFESKEITLRFAEISATSEPKLPKSSDLKSPPLQAIPPVEQDIIHHANEVMGVLKLSDEELVDKLFPDFTQKAQ